MGRQVKRTRFGIAAAVLGCALAFVAPANGAASERYASVAAAPLPPRTDFISVEGQTRAPIGWVEFCLRYKPECDTRPSTPRDVALTSKAWSDLIKVNTWVNEHITPITDIEHWGVVEQWDYPDDGKGDCEDYVLLKRRMLMEAGWPREALLITVVRDRKNEGHAVLTVKTNRGEFILDNENADIVPWTRTGYRFVKRQSQFDPNVWVSLDATLAAPPTVSSR